MPEYARRTACVESGGTGADLCMDQLYARLVFQEAVLLPLSLAMCGTDIHGAVEREPRAFALRSFPKCTFKKPLDGLAPDP